MPACGGSYTFPDDPACLLAATLLATCSSRPRHPHTASCATCGAARFGAPLSRQCWAARAAHLPRPLCEGRRATSARTTSGIIFPGHREAAGRTGAGEFYSMYVASVKRDAVATSRGLRTLAAWSPVGSANTCGWFHPRTPTSCSWLPGHAAHQQGDAWLPARHRAVPLAVPAEMRIVQADLLHGGWHRWHAEDHRGRWQRLRGRGQREPRRPLAA